MKLSRSLRNFRCSCDFVKNKEDCTRLVIMLILQVLCLSLAKLIFDIIDGGSLLLFWVVIIS